MQRANVEQRDIRMKRQARTRPVAYDSPIESSKRKRKPLKGIKQGGWLNEIMDCLNF